MIAAKDLAHLRWSIAALLLAAAAVSVALWQAGEQLGAAKQAQLQAERGYRDAHGKYSGARRDEATIRQTIEHFRELEQARMIGEESRIDWVERLRAARSAAGIEKLDFELRPRRRLPELHPGPTYMLTASSMLVRSPLPHEGRLLRLLEVLSDEPSALMRVRSCSVERPPAGVIRDLIMECDIDWLTVAPLRPAERKP